MNVMRSDKVLAPKGRGRGRTRGRIGALNVNAQASTNILPKYQIPEVRKPLINFAPSSSSTATPKSSSRRGYGTTTSSSCRKSYGTGRTTDSRKTATSGSNVDNSEVLVIIAITCGRGDARGEVGLAAIDIQYPHMVLCQISDYNSYINTLTKIHAFSPVEIIMPDTICEDGHNLYSAIHSRFPNLTITGIQRTHFTAPIGLERIRTYCAKDFSSVELIVHQKYYALAAAAALMKYIEYIQHIQYLPKSMRIQYEGSANSTIIDIESAQSLELVIAQGGQHNYSLLGALDRCSTPMGRRLLRASILQPPCNQSFIEARQVCIAELVSNRSLIEIIQPVVRRLFGGSRLLGLAMYSPHSDSIHRAERNLNYMLLLKNIIDIIPEFRVALNTAQAPFFKKVLSDLKDDRFDKIKEKILNIIHEDAKAVVGFTSSNMQRCFAIKTGISDMLDIARQTYCEIIDDMKTMVGKLGDKYNLPLSLGCNSTWGYHIEMEAGRNYDLNDLPEEFLNAKKQKNTVFMTTEHLIVLSIHCEEASDELHMMSDVLLREVIEILRDYIGCLFQFNDNVAELDLILSLAQISAISDYVKPTFGSNLELRNSKHPVMDIFGLESPTPNDGFASAALNFHTITGPNMSGKTIYLKQIVLLQIVAQLGCFVPAAKAQFRIADRIFSKVGVRDDIEYNASTFMLEMTEAQYILQSVTPTSLIVIDELARSTTVEEGASIAWAICEELSNTSAFTFHATHFLQLLKMADLYPNITNHYLEAILSDESNIDESRLIYTHRLKQGTSTIKLYGLTLARLTVLPNDILRKSRALAADILKALQPVVHETDVQDKISSQRKMNYESLVAIHDEFQKQKINLDKIYEYAKNCKLIDEDKEALITSSRTQYSEKTPIKKQCTESAKIQLNLSEITTQKPSLSSKVDHDFKKPNPLDTPRSIKDLSLPVQGTSALHKRASIAPPSSAPEPKVPKLSQRVHQNLQYSSQRFNNDLDMHTPIERKEIFKNPLTNPNSPLFMGNHNQSRVSPKSLLEKSVYERSSSGASTSRKDETSRPSSSSESPFFIPRLGVSKSKEKIAHNSIYLPQSYIPTQYLDMKKAINTMKRMNISQEGETEDENEESNENDGDRTTSETFNSEFEMKSIKECTEIKTPTSIDVFAKSEFKSRMNIPLDNIPEQYSYMRHILKHVSLKLRNDFMESHEPTNTSKKIDEYIVLSDAVKRGNTSPDSDIDSNMQKFPSESSLSMIPQINLFPTDRNVQYFHYKPSVLDFTTLSYGANLLDDINPISPLQSDLSINTTIARTTAREKEAEIFKIIEGNDFDKNNILGSVKSHVSITSSIYKSQSFS